MSQQRDCQFFEAAPNLWYLLLDNSGIANAWDWRENAECFGPFSTLESATAELDNHSNPGGWTVVTNENFRRDDVYNTAIATAKRSSR